MKLLFCQDCKDIIAPFYENGKLRHCHCNRHSVWWENKNEGTLKVKDIYGRNNRAYIIGLANDGLLLAPHREWTKQTAHDNLLNVKAGSLFEQTQSLVWRVRPEEHPKISWV